MKHSGYLSFIFVLAACRVAAAFPDVPELTKVTPPEHVGMDEAKLREARNYALTGGGSGCVLRGGRVVVAWGDQQQKYDLYSSTKSIGVTALGLALMDGKVRLEDKAQTHLPSVGVPPAANGERGWLDELTLRHLATQTGGFEKTRGWCRQLHRPGTRWLYSDGGPNWLADCLTTAYGRDLLEVMRERVFEPLGIAIAERKDGPGDLQWGFNNLDRPPQLNGINRRPFGAGIHANVQAMAKLGYLYLRQGKWQGKQILSPEFVRMVGGPAPGIAALPVENGGELYWSAGAAKHYGLLWWNNADGAIEGVPRDAFWSWGMKESFILVVPSLDIVAVRAGEFLRPREDSGRSDIYNHVFKPFILPICQSVAKGAPYPPSPFITSIAWAPVESIVCPARKADNWPITWADDGDQYTAFGDGWGFANEYPKETKLSLGFSRIAGDLPNVSGLNIPSDADQKGGGARGKKASGLLMVDGTLYMWVRNAEPGTGQQSRLAWSTDHAKTWSWSDWKFPEFGYPCFLNFGQNYAGARDGFVYSYSPDTPSAYYETDSVVLMRVPKTRIRERVAYEFFKGFNADGQPVWTRDVAERKPVFTFPGGCNRMDVTYNAGLGRYLMVMRSRPRMSIDAHLPDKSSAQGINQFSIYDAPEPWGPWTTVYYSEQWEGTPLKNLQYWQGWGESSHLPSKWMSPDGKSVHLLFAGGPGGFSIREARLTTAESWRPVLDARWRSRPDTNTGFIPPRDGSSDEWLARRAHLKKQILWSAGLWPMPERTPLRTRIFDRVDHGDYTMEKVSFESAPGLYVCGNLYRPKNHSPRGHPGILNPHGHAKTGRLNDTEIASYQARCITFARLGGVAFMWDMMDYNDSAKQLGGEYRDDNYMPLHKGNWSHERDRRALWNVNSLGLQLWNSIRALDFLASLPEVDPTRLASTGESGGGTQTSLLAAVDERVKVAAPVCMVSSFMQGGCTCENAPGLRFDTHNVEFAKIMAPRPQMLISVTQDWTRHTETVELPALRGIYNTLGAVDSLAHAHFDARHGYNLDMRNAVYPWLGGQLALRVPAGFREPPYQPERPSDLLAFRDAVPENAIRNHAALVRGMITRAEAQLQRVKTATDEGRMENREIFGEGFRLAVGSKPVGSGDVSYVREASIEWHGMAGERGVLLGPRGARIPIRIFAPSNAGGGSDSCALFIDGDGNEALSSRAAVMRDLLAAGQTVQAIDVFGVGSARPPAEVVDQRGREPYFLTFNRSDDAERILDIVTAIAHCRQRGATGKPPRQLTIAGFGRAGPWLAVAGALLPATEGDGPPLSFAIDANAFNTPSEERYLEDLFIPGILRAGGLGNAAALIHPRRLLLYNTDGKFDVSRVRAAYRASETSEGQGSLDTRPGLMDDKGLLRFMTKREG